MDPTVYSLVYSFVAELLHPLWFESKKGVSLCSVILKPRRKRKIGKW